MKNRLFHVKALSVLFFVLMATASYAQKYEIDASNVKLEPVEGLFRMGHPGPAGKEIKVTTQYLTIGGEPATLVMGEVHFSRMNPEQWEETILKMKACGVDIIATYLFWMHHEEIEGQFEWEGRKNLRAFLELCGKHDVYAFPRIGPWSHGEARLGGMPDWVERKQFVKSRVIGTVYFTYVERYYTEISRQMEGLYYKDGGPVIGVQLENECVWPQCEPYLQWLKDLAQNLGIDVPIYSATGWSEAPLPPYEMLGVYGGYAEAPWDQHIERDVLYHDVSYSGEHRAKANEYQRDDPDPYQYPKFNNDVNHRLDFMPLMDCEIGCGLQNTYTRRFVVDDMMPLVMPFCNLAKGSTVLGYYVFTGITHPHGELQTTSEDHISGYHCRIPSRSMDYQAAIRESGEISEGYKKMKGMHYFLNEYGSLLATMTPVSDNTTKNVSRTAKNPNWITVDPDNLRRFKVRSDNHSGFLFGVNYTRFTPKTVEHPKFKVKFQDETISLPRSDIAVEDGTVFIWPLNFDMGGCRIKYATAQLLQSIGDYYFFHQNSDMTVEFELDNSQIEKVTCSSGKVEVKNDRTIIEGLQPGMDCVINVALKSGETRTIVVLTEKEATDTWIFKRDGKKELYISGANMYADNSDVYIFSDRNEMDGFRFVPQDDLQKAPFEAFSVSVPAVELDLELEPRPILKDAMWLATANFDKLERTDVVKCRSFFKEFSLENPSSIKKATLYLYPEADCWVQMNEARVNGSIQSGKLNALDITGYVKKGENMMAVNFPYTAGHKKMAARIRVEYMNLDMFETFSDSSWVTTDMNWFPAYLNRNFGNPVAPVVVPAPDYAEDITCETFGEWELDIPVDVFDGLNNVYLHTEYLGDEGGLYNGYMLVADDFNNNTHWSIGLNKLERSPGGNTLRMIILPLSRDAKIFFDNPPEDDEYDITGIRNFRAIPEYKTIVQ